MKRLFNVSVWLGCRTLALLACFALLGPTGAYAQGVTTGAISGLVTDATKAPVAGASVIAIHMPSGTSYEAVTNAQGRFSIPGMRVGGPYTVTVTPPAGGASFDPQVQDSIEVNLGTATDIEFNVAALSETVTVTAQSDTVFSSNRTGAATTISRATLASLPTISNRLQDIVRLTPQASGMSFAGQDTRMNNVTVDGSYFNNSFGLRSTLGDSSGVAPISLQAIEQVQISIAPYDVRQGNFVGAGVNTVTRSGTNQFRGSFYHQFRDESLVGTEAKALTVNPGTFNFRNTGGWGAGPVFKNKVFFFGNYENEALTSPGTTFRANTGNEPVAGSTTRVRASDLDALSTYLKTNFAYDTGPYQGYDHQTPAIRFLGKGDYNLNDKNKMVFRYIHLDSDTDILLSNSTSLGNGNRRTNLDALNFQNSNYQMVENIRSFVGELNSIIGTKMSNSLIVGYSKHDESRGFRGSFFPLVDILENGLTYTSFGFEPFTPNNELRYNSLQIQDNFTIFGPKHSLTFGMSAERYESENVFFQGAQSVYVYNSLADFYTDANGYLANRNRTTSPVTLRLFQVGYNNIPGQEKPIQPLEVLYMGAYAQDEWRPAGNLSVTYGLRIDVPSFGDTGYPNVNADALTFRDEAGNPVQYSSGKLPDSNLLWSPRVGFNWDISGNRRTQVRGGTGVFTGKPAYVWISNQVGNTGMLTGFDSFTNTTTRPFNPDTERYKPTNVTGAPAASYALAVTNPDFKFPQIWRSNIGVDHRLPWGWRGTAEYIYNRDVNGIYYINANLPAAQTAFVGVDNRPRYTANRINNVTGNQVTSAIALKNQNIGRSWNMAFSADKALKDGLWLKAGYGYGRSRNTIDPGSIAAGSWQNNAQAADPNNPPLAYSSFSPGHRVFVAASYTREYFRFGGTTVSAYWEARQGGNPSFIFASDMNGDSGINDLLYIHRDTSEMNFQAFTVGTGATARSFSAAEQAQAWDSFISSDKYLSSRRGQYAERGAVFLPMERRVDLSVSQDLFVNLMGRRHSFQFRADILNFGNLLNDNWGVGKRLTSNSPLTNPAVDANGRPTYRMRVISNELVKTSLEQTAGLGDVYRVQFSLRYTF